MDKYNPEAITRTDQLLSYYVMDIAAAIPGLSGLFIAGVFSAALSTMSTSLNSLGATLFEDFIRPCLKNKLTDRCASNILKLIVVVVGAVCVLMVFIVDKLGSVLQVKIK
ncbi:Sodium-coupled monocarboxylate transporter 2 [Blattella germanica]|nr:Sodium-coupled monocarboxylate transporter 2 [Blattella germanica]